MLKFLPYLKAKDHIPYAYLPEAVDLSRLMELSTMKIIQHKRMGALEGVVKRVKFESYNKVSGCEKAQGQVQIGY